MSFTKGLVKTAFLGILGHRTSKGFDPQTPGVVAKTRRWGRSANIIPVRSEDMKDIVGAIRLTDKGVVTHGIPDHEGFLKKLKKDPKFSKAFDEYAKHHNLKKESSDPIIFSNIGRSLSKGLKAGGEHTVKDTLKLKGLKHIRDAVHNAGGTKKSLTTQAGRERLAEGVGKAAPSLAMGGAYAAGLKKVYDRVSKEDTQQTYGGYY